jgi:hypothetical protein
MAKNIYLVGGSKGGVGKSIVSMSVLDFLQERGEQILFIETDTSNPDVWKAYRDSVESEQLNLDDVDGWIQLVNISHAHSNSTIVINTAARNNLGVSAYGTTLANTLGELERKLVTLWVINRQRDSLELLKEYMETLNDTEIHVIRNGYFGEERKFEIFNNSAIKKTVEGRGGWSWTFPDLADRVSDELYSKRMSIAKASKEMPIGNRAELARWRGVAGNILKEIIHE